jgi:hypothetical protein
VRTRIHAAAAFALLMGTTQAVSAQTTPWKDRARVSIDFGVQPSSATFTAATTKPVYLETSTITTTYSLPSGPLFDGGVLVRVKRGFGVGVAISSFSKSQTAAVTGSIPHPFFYNTPRSISGTSAALERSEAAVHIQAAYVISSKRFDVAISGGPSFFNVSQDAVGDATYTETYPYDAATFTAATVTKATATALGFNAGADIGYKLSKNVGVGALVRFSRATLSFPLANSAAGVSTDAGGPQLAGGVRFFF